MRNIQFLFVAMVLSLNVLAQVPQMHRNHHNLDNGSIDILSKDGLKSIPSDSHDSPVKISIQNLMLLNEKSINDIKSFVCQNYPITFNDGSVGYENKIFVSKDNIKVNLRLGQNSLHVVFSSSSSTKTLAIPYSSILFYTLENDELKVTLVN